MDLLVPSRGTFNIYDKRHGAVTYQTTATYLCWKIYHRVPYPHILLFHPRANVWIFRSRLLSVGWYS